MKGTKVGETGKTLRPWGAEGPTTLTPRLNSRIAQIVDLMVFNDPPYDLYDAAAAAGYRRKAARDLQASPPFQAAYMKALAALRNGEYAKSIKTIAQIRDDFGDNKAADRKVRLQACQALLGEAGGDVTVVNVTQDLDYVIRLDEPPKTIEGDAEL
jgi:hypothetical protein